MPDECLPSCPCRRPFWHEGDRSVSIFSTGAVYTVEEIEPGVYAYQYQPEAP